MVGILRESDREPVAQVAKKHGISEQTIYTWRQRFSGMNADEVKRLRHDRYPDSVPDSLRYRFRLRRRTGEKLVSHPWLYGRVLPVLALRGHVPGAQRRAVVGGGRCRRDAGPGAAAGPPGMGRGRSACPRPAGHRSQGRQPLRGLDPGRPVRSVRSRDHHRSGGRANTAARPVAHGEVNKACQESVRTVLASGEPLPPQLRAEVEAAWDCEVFDHWGRTGAGHGGGVECSAHSGYHLREADLLLEITDPATGTPLPPGELGEIPAAALGRLAADSARRRSENRTAHKRTRPGMSDILPTLLQHLERGETLVQATILTHEGSTPRSAGSRMLLAADGNGGVRIAAGTVGGGLVEARVMARAAQVLADGKRCVEAFDLTGELAAGADMICGGRLRVFLESLAPDGLPLFRRLDQALTRGQRCLRLTPLEAGPGTLLLPAGQGAGAELPAALAQAAHAAGADINAPVVLEHSGLTFALEPWAAASPLYIFGAGHVSRPTAQVAEMLGFCVTVLDDRAEFANAQRFPQANIRVLDSYGDCFAGLPSGPEAFVVIVTRGHMYDAEVLAQALRTQAGYIGMIGSRRKRGAVYERLRGQGFTDADLARVHCPVGLDIGAETPEEIAVSIAAELIACRAGVRAGRMPL